MNNIIIRFAKENDLNKLYEVYSKTLPNTFFTINDLKNYFNIIPNSILIGLIDNKIVAHLFCHPIKIEDYNDTLLWSNPKYYNPNGDGLLVWGAGILQEYRTNYNFAWSIHNKLVETSFNTYKNIEKLITYVFYTDKPIIRWHGIVGYQVVNIINGINMPDNSINHLYVLELDLKSHLKEYGFSRMKRVYGFVNNGIIPEFLEG